MAKTPTIRQLQKIATSLGYRGLKSFAELYVGGTKTAFGHPQNSAPTLWIHLKPNTDQVQGIEVHTTYFKITDEVISVNKFIGDGTKSVSEIIEFLRK